MAGQTTGFAYTSISAAFVEHLSHRQAPAVQFTPGRQATCLQLQLPGPRVRSDTRPHLSQQLCIPVLGFLQVAALELIASSLLLHLHPTAALYSTRPSTADSAAYNATPSVLQLQVRAA